MHGISVFWVCVVLCAMLLVGDNALAAAADPAAMEAAVASAAANASTTPWWVWAIALFVVTFLIGIVAVLGGVGGGVLFVPIVGGFFFPFHLDFVRGAGLLVALAGALAAGPGLLRSGMANLRLAIPLAVIASASSIVGAMMGLALPANVVQISLGVTILGIVLLMWRSKKSEFPHVEQADDLSSALHINGIYHDAASNKAINWQVHRTKTGMGLFVGIGVMAGMFGLGAGWANVPVLNLLMGAPLKVSVATSKFMLSIVDTSAAWVYLNSGAVLAIIAVPAIVGIMLGSLVGVRLLSRTNAAVIRKVVIGMLFFAGARALMKGLGF
jgi:uncharacterized membrane protein YfcA